jgi:hypothetical protein
MAELWENLWPLILASAAMPVQSVVALALVRSSLRSAYAWVAGMIAVRLLQGVLFGIVLAPLESGPDSGPQYFLGTLLLVLALLLYVKGLRAAMDAEDEDAPPPKWLTKAGAMSPLAAFGVGAAFMTISAKFLAFTIGAIGAIADAHLGPRLATVTFVMFVLLAQSTPIAIVGLASSSSPRADAILDGLRNWLQRNRRAINITFAAIFGTWFLLKAGARLW